MSLVINGEFLEFNGERVAKIMKPGSNDGWFTPYTALEAFKSFVDKIEDAPEHCSCPVYATTIDCPECGHDLKLADFEI